ncbi:hypothetical protein CHGG_03038 [Chaetomium globosum CBS 148.51]|uniref:Very-long-chain (3R)-3-hydroxyacyl-CoA dehydratase n=1 Tax=Chaetomium globosum (strain ATCC 6205 / CBS 148.51 / DSM 1962 / NBRC 6347 / NRRL 1970) TaxID=306901 RepID=Q2H9R6_CHAGB|nr:uncharacterized protein CHGG_03038 [Chaetomium globosum CBS 148.51]EAQ91103.1 hypothetical protein CHGG_03038 [Chaetomium globosum CBS 148.51]
MAKQTGFGPKKAYLILYNAASAVAWATILGRVAVVLGWKGAPFVPLVVDNFARITQTFAIMEVVHALTVASRLFLVWGICYPFPQLNTNVFYSTMLVAWSLTEVMRYSYFALKQIDAVPAWLHWLRYSAFLVLYPVGISSEVAMTLSAIWGPADELSSWYTFGLTLVLAAYGPGE